MEVVFLAPIGKELLSSRRVAIGTYASRPCAATVFAYYVVAFVCIARQCVEGFRSLASVEKELVGSVAEDARNSTSLFRVRKCQARKLIEYLLRIGDFGLRLAVPFSVSAPHCELFWSK